MMAMTITPVLWWPSTDCTPIDPIGGPSQSDSRPVHDFILLTAELFNFEFELYRTASVAFPDRFSLFYISLDEQVLYVGYSIPFFLNAVFVLFHCQSPSQRF
jgi:hypothetical protein